MLSDHDAQTLTLLAARLARDLGDRIEERRATLQMTASELTVELVWQLWDAVYEFEREQRAEWITAELADDAEEQRLRKEHGAQYESWRAERNAEVRAMLVRFVERQRND